MTLRPLFLRHSSFVTPATLDDVLSIVGCGAVGSHIAMLAARMGYMRFSLWDADVVEPHNLPNQEYLPSQIGMLKVEALKQQILAFNPAAEIEIHPYFFTEEHKINISGPVIISTDSLLSRSIVMAACENNIHVSTVIETRLGFTHGEIAIVNPLNTKQLKNWKASIGKDEDVPEGPCNQRLCTTLVQLVSSYVVHQLCERKSKESKTEEWKYASRTIVQMNPFLQVLTMKDIDT